jgi:hypothetical protein
MNSDASNALQPVAPTETNSTAYIYRLPNEVLDMIFNFLFALSKRSPFPKDAHLIVDVSPVLTVRWVCSWFRKIASHNPIWLDDRYSDLSSFVPCISGKLIHNRGPFLEKLLDDDNLCNCLRRRETWEFTASVDFLAVTEKTPSLVNNTRTVRLLNIDADLPAVINILGVFEGLTTLTIDVEYDLEYDLDFLSCLLDLNAIARSCPLLKELELYAFTQFCGSLSTLKDVEELTIHISDPFSIKDRCRLIPLLPVESSHCLSRLHFRFPTDFDEYHDPASNPFDSFVNLTSLDIDIYLPEVLDFIAKASFSLIELTIVGMIRDYGTNIDNQGPLALSRLLSATSLKSLQRFNFDALDDYRFEDSQISAIAALEDLEYLYLAVIISEASWFVLASPRKLKYLTAYVEPGKFCGKESMDAFTSRIKERGGFNRVDSSDYASLTCFAER